MNELLNWSDIERHELWSRLSPSQKREAREKYYEQYILPRKPEELSEEEVRSAWMEGYDDDDSLGEGYRGQPDDVPTWDDIPDLPLREVEEAPPGRIDTYAEMRATPDYGWLSSPVDRRNPLTTATGALRTGALTAASGVMGLLGDIYGNPSFRESAGNLANAAQAARGVGASPFGREQAIGFETDGEGNILRDRDGRPIPSIVDPQSNVPEELQWVGEMAVAGAEGGLESIPAMAGYAARGGIPGLLAGIYSQMSGTRFSEIAQEEFDEAIREGLSVPEASERALALAREHAYTSSALQLPFEVAPWGRMLRRTGTGNALDNIGTTVFEEAVAEPAGGSVIDAYDVWARGKEAPTLEQFLADRAGEAVAGAAGGLAVSGTIQSGASGVGMLRQMTGVPAFDAGVESVAPTIREEQEARLRDAMAAQALRERQQREQQEQAQQEVPSPEEREAVQDQITSWEREKARREEREKREQELFDSMYPGVDSPSPQEAPQGPTSPSSPSQPPPPPSPVQMPLEGLTEPSRAIEEEGDTSLTQEEMENAISVLDHTRGRRRGFSQRRVEAQGEAIRQLLEEGYTPESPGRNQRYAEIMAEKGFSTSAQENVAPEDAGLLGRIAVDEGDAPQAPTEPSTPVALQQPPQEATESPVVPQQPTQDAPREEYDGELSFLNEPVRGSQERIAARGEVIREMQEEGWTGSNKSRREEISRRMRARGFDESSDENLALRPLSPPDDTTAPAPQEAPQGPVAPQETVDSREVGSTTRPLEGPTAPSSPSQPLPSTPIPQTPPEGLTERSRATGEPESPLDVIDSVPDNMRNRVQALGEVMAELREEGWGENQQGRRAEIANRMTERGFPMEALPDVTRRTERDQQKVPVSVGSHARVFNPYTKRWSDARVDNVNTQADEITVSFQDGSTAVLPTQEVELSERIDTPSWIREGGGGGGGDGRPSPTPRQPTQKRPTAPSPLPGAPRVKGATGPDPALVRVAEKYARDNNIPFERQSEYSSVDVDFARRIAEAYERMEHAPDDPVVKEAYENLIRQTRAQYDALVEDGYSFTFFDSESDPYGGNPWNAMRDLRNNKTMAVYGTYDGYGTRDGDFPNHPLMQDTGLQWPDQSGRMRPVTANDLFRAVHDAFGHGLEGAGFRARGEENAWQAHAALFTGSALAALTTETRGQNSWLNYGPYGETNRTASVEETVFADQKAGLLPEWAWTDNRSPRGEKQPPPTSPRKGQQEARSPEQKAAEKAESQRIQRAERDARMEAVRRLEGNMDPALFRQYYEEERAKAGLTGEAPKGTVKRTRGENKWADWYEAEVNPAQDASDVRPDLVADEALVESRAEEAAPYSDADTGVKLLDVLLDQLERSGKIPPRIRKIIEKLKNNSHVRDAKVVVVEVWDLDTAERTAGLDALVDNNNPSPAVYDPNNHTIYLKGNSWVENGLNPVEALHEVVHAATYNAIEGVKQGLDTNPETIRAVQDLENIMKALAEDSDSFIEFDSETRSMMEYATLDVHEFVAVVPSDPQVQTALKEKGLFPRFIDAVRRLLGLSRLDRPAIEYILDSVEQLIDLGDGVPRIFDGSQEAGAVRTAQDANFGQEGTNTFNEGDYRPQVVSWAKDRFGDAVAENGRPVWQNFTEWFGDSQVVDADGNPLVVYHGTDEEFDVFEMNRPARRAVMFDEREVESQGSFFSEDEADARSYGRNVMPVYLSVQNPFIQPDYIPISSRDPEAVQLAQRAWEDAEYILEPLIYEDAQGRRLIDYNNGISATEVDPDGEWIGKLFVDGKIDWDVLDNPDVVARMKERGYDGARVNEPNDESGSSWFVVRDVQVKSATGNQGTFGLESPSILRSPSRGEADSGFVESDYRPEVVSWAKRRWGEEATAPNGNPIWQNFVAWFGDSQAVDADGNPVIIYHGTPEPGFETFLLQEKRPGAYMSDNPSVAQGYASEQGESTGGVYPLLASMKRPLVIDAGGRRWTNLRGSSTYYGGERTPFTIEQVIGSENVDTDVLVNALKGNDTYDGVIIRNVIDNANQDDLTVSDVYIVFDPGQVKSSIGNVGDFSPQRQSVVRSPSRREAGSTDNQPSKRELLDQLRARRLAIEKARDEGEVSQLEADALLMLQTQREMEAENAPPEREPLEDVVIPTGREVLERGRGAAPESPVTRRMRQVGNAVRGLFSAHGVRGRDVDNIDQAVVKGLLAENTYLGTTLTNSIKKQMARYNKNRKPGSPALTDATVLRAMRTGNLKSLPEGVRGPAKEAIKLLQLTSLDAVISLVEGVPDGKALSKKQVQRIENLIASPSMMQTIFKSQSNPDYATRMIRNYWEGADAVRGLREEIKENGLNEREVLEAAQKGDFSSLGEGAVPPSIANQKPKAWEHLSSTLLVEDALDSVISDVLIPLDVAGKVEDGSLTRADLIPYHRNWVGTSIKGKSAEQLAEELDRARDDFIIKSGSVDENGNPSIDIMAMAALEVLAAPLEKGKGFGKMSMKSGGFIPDAVKALHGEIESPVVSYLHHLEQATQSLGHAKLLNRINELWTENGGLADARTAKNTVAIIGSEYGPMDGKFTTPRKKDILDSLVKTNEGVMDFIEALASSDADVVKAVAGTAALGVQSATSYLKAQQIIGNPANFLLNALGAPEQLMASGNIPIINKTLGFQGVKRGISAAQGLVLIGSRSKINENTRKIMKAGMAEHSQVAEIKGLLRRPKVRAALDRATTLEKFFKETWNLVRSGALTVAELYTVQDLWISSTAYFKNEDDIRAHWDKVGKKYTEDELVEEAGRISRMSTIVMAQIPTIVRLTEKLGLTYVAPYLYAAHRSLLYNGYLGMAQTAEGLRTGDMDYARVGAARMIGSVAAATSFQMRMAPVYAVMYGVLSAFTGTMEYITGSDDEDDEIELEYIKSTDMFADAHPVVMGRGEDGGLYVTDFNRAVADEPGRLSLEHSIELFRGVLSGDMDREEAARNIQKQWENNVFRNAPVVKAYNALFGENPSFTSELRRQDRAAYDTLVGNNKTLQRTLGVVELMVPSGLRSVAMEWVKDKAGIITPEEVSRLKKMGFPIYELNPFAEATQNTYNRGISKYRNQYRDARREFKNVVGLLDEELTEAQIEAAYVEFAKQQLRGYVETLPTFRAAKAQGYSHQEIERAIKDNSIGLPTTLRDSLLTERFSLNTISDNFFESELDTVRNEARRRGEDGPAWRNHWENIFRERLHLLKNLRHKYNQIYFVEGSFKETGE